MEQTPPICSGARPSMSTRFCAGRSQPDIPVDQPTKFDLIINRFVAVMSQLGGCSRSSTKVMVNGWPATVLPKASVNGKDAHCLSVCATAMRYDERSVSDASLN